MKARIGQENIQGREGLIWVKASCFICVLVLYALDLNDVSWALKQKAGALLDLPVELFVLLNKYRQKSKVLGVERNSYLHLVAPHAVASVQLTPLLAGHEHLFLYVRFKDTSLNLIMVFEKPALFCLCACVCVCVSINKLNANVPTLFTDSDMKC